jgi:O-antigen ligase/polysaccharide polymerase Wzy-like membrane protein
VINAFASRSEQAFRHVPVGLLALGASSLAWNQLGSILARDWLPYAIATALLVAGVLWSGLAQRPPTLALAGLAGLLGLAAWDALSLTWSPVPALARDEALLVVFYALAFLVPLLVTRTVGDRRTATAIVVALSVALAVSTFMALLLVEHVTEDYENGRLTFPISYVNAQAALFLLGFWPCVALASERANRPLLRGLAAGGSCALLAGWLMTQSKGGLIALTLAGVAFFALTRDRLRIVVPTLIPVVLIGASYELLTRPYRQRFDSGLADAIRVAAWTALVLTVLGVAAGYAFAVLDGRISVSPQTRRRAGIALLAALAAAVLGSAAAFFVVVDRPGHFVQDKWRSFKSIPAHERGSSHLTSLGSNRYDFWRVELDLARDHPLIGAGARGFAPEYLAVRRSDETPARGHSLLLDQLGETGLIGLGLLAAAIGFPVAGALARARSNILAAGVAAAVVYGFVHTAGDWVWTFPAVGLPLFLFLGIANAGTADDRPPPLVRGWVAGVSAAAALALAVGAFCLPWLSARLTQAALRHPASPAGDLRWARRLDPLAVEPLLAEATLARQPEDAVAALRRALAKQPDVSSLHYRLGLAELAAGNRRAARIELAEAHRLDPRSDIVASALERASR